MGRHVGPVLGATMLALFLVGFIEAGKVARHGHITAAITIAAGASLAGLGALLLAPTGRRR